MPTLMAEPAVETIYLHPGQLYAASEPKVISTILGSCVSVCLWDAEAEVAGINHFLLPLNPVRSANDPRYGNVAMEQLLNAMVRHGAAPDRMIAKLFGGASVVTAFSGSRQAIGDQNVEAARKALSDAGIRITGEQVGGRRGRKLLFHTCDGSAYLKEI
jgi:chemotaxis protein CheD